jgi:hypothetical protein
VLTVELGLLYHWSPADRFDAIYRDGLRPHAPNTVASSTLPYVCLSPSPAAAWSLSGGMDWVSEVDEWDLWMVRLADGDQVCIRGEFGPKIEEVKVYGPLPADRLWWVARRITGPANTCGPSVTPGG